MFDLDNVLSNDEVPSEQVEAATEESTEESTETVETKEETPEVTTEETDSKEEAKEETTASGENVEQAWTKAMALDERKKRQDSEKATEALQKQLDDIKQSSDKAAIPDVLEDQEGFTKTLQSQYKAELANQKIEMSRQMMMTVHDDYEEAEKVFMEMAAASPLLRDQAAKDPFPARFVYEQAKKHKEFTAMQDIDSYKNRIRAELKAEIEADIKTTADTKSKKGDNLEASLANTRSSDNSNQPTAKTVDDIFD